MSKKLSEIKDNEVLLVHDFVIDKEDYVKELLLGEYEDLEIYTTTEYKAHINARDMLKSAIEYELENMYPGWDYDIWQDITEEDIKQLQNIIDTILSRSSNVSYHQDEEVEIDI